MRRIGTVGDECGFSLVEVMVALIIICVGLLGIAKLEALMLSNSGTSRVRALVALQTSSLANAMHADRDYWDGSSTTYWDPSKANLTLNVSESSGTLAAWTGTNAPATGDPSCQDAVCNSEQLAAADLSNWATDMQQILKTSFTSSIACSQVPITLVVSCTISVTWNENTVAANSQEAAQQATNGAPTAFQSQTYTLVVEP
jgi:type IV pilus assembly protein PilV